jgi:hypothetical protein
MANEFDWKKFQFIIEVQTALVNNAINRSLDEDAIAKRTQFNFLLTPTAEMLSFFRQLRTK